MVRFWIKASMGVMGAMEAVVDVEVSQVSAFLTCWE